MKYLIILAFLFISCKKEPMPIEPKEQYSCSESQKKLMHGFITAYLEKQIKLSKTQKAMMMPMLTQEAVKTFCIINRN